ncbi:MAG: hypothetical protein V2A73_00420 [Pseudomonadota bacterium]
MIAETLLDIGREKGKSAVCLELAVTLGLVLPDGCDPVEALRLDLRRLLEAQQRWAEACDIARRYCPVDSGESHIRQGIPRLALERAEAVAKLVQVGELLAKNGCDCGCAHDAESHDDDCERCLACRIDEAIR